MDERLNTPLYIFDPSLDYKAKITNYIELRWLENYRRPNEFELLINRDNHYVQYLRQGYIVAIKNSDGYSAGLIENEEIDIEGSGKAQENWRFTGRGLDSLMANRSALHGVSSGTGYDSVSGVAVETAMRHYVYNNCINADNPNRNYALLELEPDQERGIGGGSGYLTNAVPIMTGYSAPSGIVTKSSDHVGYEAWKAFDRNKDYWWISEKYEKPSWVAYEFPAVIQIERYKIINGYATVSSPKDWKLQGWDGADWVDLDIRVGQPTWQPYEERTFNITSPGEYIKYRLYVLESQSGSYTAILAGLELHHYVYDDVFRYDARFQKLDELLESLSLISGLGWGIILDADNSKLKFRVYEGLDRSWGNGINSPVSFSPKFANISKVGYKYNRTGSYNVAVVAGQGEAQDRAIETVDYGGLSYMGTNRREIFIDARDLDLSDKLIQRGQEKLNELAPELSFEFENANRGPFYYQTHYNLGDIVSVFYPELVSASIRILGVELNISAQGKTYRIITGKDRLDTVGLLRYVKMNINPEIRR